MTLDDWEKTAVGIVTAAVAGLIALVRGSDIRRIEAIEKRQDAQEKNGDITRKDIHDEIKDLRQDVNNKHLELVKLISGRSQ